MFHDRVKSQFIGEQRGSLPEKEEKEEAQASHSDFEIVGILEMTQESDTGQCRVLFIGTRIGLFYFIFRKWKIVLVAWVRGWFVSVL